MRPGGTTASRAKMRATALIVRWFASTPHRTFIVYPAFVVLFEVAIRRHQLIVDLWGAPLLVWGYLQYRFIGLYRVRAGGGGPGTHVPPVRLVTSGPYRFTRNPMYLGHLIFLLGLALTFRSWFGLALFLVHIPWFNGRILRDEVRLKRIFGDDYARYLRRTRRWIPAIV
jgi:protein-S-isoprenylcysteine O-methyltransferase Ste14